MVGRRPAIGPDVPVLAFARNAPRGRTFLTFEFNQVAGTWENDKGERVPCRRDGDILVSYEILGTRPRVSLRKWHTRLTDPEAGCDRTGTINPFTTVSADVEAQGALNGGPIANGLPGISGGTIPAFQFGEAALDLDALLGPAFEGGCFAFGSIWMHSRSSVSYRSEMQDRVAPTPITLRTCAAEGTKFYDLDANGVRDPKDPGIPGFQIYADYNDDGDLDPGEPSTVSDSSGRYVLNDIRGGPYRLRERLLPTRQRSTNRWLCSFPNPDTDGGFGGLGLGFPCGWGPIDPDEEADAKGRDFGNWAEKLPPDPPDPTDPPVPPDPSVPPQPPEPMPPTPVVPDEPSAVFPTVPAPPRAGAAGVAGIASSRLARCVTRLPGMSLRGTHISRVTVTVDGRRAGVLRATPLQRRLRISRPMISRLGRLAPGPHRVAARVRFRLGSGARPLKLVRRVRICRALLPRFTG